MDVDCQCETRLCNGSRKGAFFAPLTVLKKTHSLLLAHLRGDVVGYEYDDAASCGYSTFLDDES